VFAVRGRPDIHTPARRYRDLGSRLPKLGSRRSTSAKWRSRLHLRKALIDERTQWLLRIRSVLYHHGLSSGGPARIARSQGLAFVDGLRLPDDARERVIVALTKVDALDRETHDLERAARHRAPPDRVPGADDPVATLTKTERLESPTR
jgi:hypothetical protein